jgi:tRNA(Ile)-lysidine synthase
VPFEPGLELAVGNWRLESAVLSEGWTQPTRGEVDCLSAIFDHDLLHALPGLVWRTRRPGDFIEPMGMSGRKRLQDVMVDAKIPRELRDHIPLLAVEGANQVLWIPGKGGRRSKHAPVTARTRKAVAIRWAHEE